MKNMWPYLQWVDLHCSIGKKCYMNMVCLKRADQANSFLKIKGEDIMI